MTDTTPPDLPPTPPYLGALTPLRGIAAVTMVAYHFNMFVMPVIDPAVTRLHQHGYLLVDFFFILSGFILSHVYGGWFEVGAPRERLRRYMRARFARVYPLHLTTLLWVVGIYLLVVVVYAAKLPPGARSVFDPWAIPLHLLMLHGLSTAPGGTWNTPSWSVGTEWLVYLAFPFLTVAFRRLATWGKLGLLVGVFGAYAYLTTPLSTDPPIRPWLPNVPYTIAEISFPNSSVRCFAGFVLGMVTHFAFSRGWGLRWLARDAAVLALVGGLLAGCHLHVPDMVTVWLLPLLILGACHNRGRTARALGTAPLRSLGEWSYSIYMVHMPIIFSFLGAQLIAEGAREDAAKPITYGLVGPASALAFVVLVVLVSALTYRVIEAPARRYLSPSGRAPR